ncbi:MAG TPA: peptide deformylase [Armatimonadota bacterium]|nr:peptide deformylase [Armatimonadota bacterium]
MQTKTSRLDIVQYPAQVLRKKAAPVDRVTPEMAYFVEEMAELMYASNGVGLAAPQVGISLRIIVVDIGDGLQELINPVIVSREGSQTGAEGCLSLPGLYGDVERADRIVIRGLNRLGKKITLAGEGYWARAMQHETDHLDGKLFTDLVIPESVHWVTGDTDSSGELIERAASLEEALRFFESKAAK